jgi:large subunit ribosomal protein L4
MKLDVRNWDNEVVGAVELPDGLFAREVSEHLVWEVVRAHLDGRRRGTHKVKGRGEVAGTGVKPWKQKHTGRARAGSRRSPLWRSGGNVHGPVPRSYAKKVNRKARRAALYGVLSQRAAEVAWWCSTRSSSTSRGPGLRRPAGAAWHRGRDVLLVDGLENLNLHLASRNRPNVTMLTPPR